MTNKQILLCYDILVNECIYCSVACGGEFINSAGIIRSPYHPRPYPHNMECVYVIRQPVGKSITLNFTSFDIEDSTWIRRCIFDYVEVRTRE